MMVHQRDQQADKLQYYFAMETELERLQYDLRDTLQ